MADNSFDHLILSLTQERDWPVVIHQLRQWLRTDDSHLDALLSEFEKVIPANDREVALKTFLLYASMRALVLVHLSSEDNDLEDSKERDQNPPMIQ
jgi:hypothetical protein